MVDWVFQTAPLHFQASIRPWMKREDGRTGIGTAQSLYMEGRKKMADAAFKELAVERVDDIEGSGGQLSFSQSARRPVRRLRREGTNVVIQRAGEPAAPW